MSGGLAIVRRVADLRRAVRGWRAQGASVGLVPTMGGLHEGHLALVRASRAKNRRTIATLFVNPKQFDRADDLALYPRDEARDAKLLDGEGCDLLFAPDVDEMYPPGFASGVAVSGLTECLDGLSRPGHFTGVTTVVAKLLLQAMADRAYFGEKDYQQLTVVRRMVRDLDIPVEIRAVPTVRAPDGLALSSRNFLLTPAQREIAPLLARTLEATAAALTAEPGATAALLAEARRRLSEGGFTEVDYLELRAADDLAGLAFADRPARLLAAAWLGSVRLIDNVEVRPAG